MRRFIAFFVLTIWALASAAQKYQARLPNEGAKFSSNTSEQFAAFVKSEIAKWAPVVKASGARVD